MHPSSKLLAGRAAPTSRPARPQRLLLSTGMFAAALLSADAIAATAASASLTFDVDTFTASRGSGVDLTRFDKGNVVLAGTYRVDVIVNQSLQARRDVTFRAAAGTDRVMPCFDRAMLGQLGVDLEKLENAAGAPGLSGRGSQEDILCDDLGLWISGASAEFDASQQALTISVPQIYMRRSAQGYVDPALWDDGIDAALLAYNFTSSTATSGNAGSQSYLGLNGGVNLGPWRLRHQGAQGWNSLGGRQPYQNTASYLQRGIASLKSQLTIGDSFSNGQIIDSVRLRGVSLASDERMLPQSQQGYAPVVRGVAESNARVSISQNGYKIYETTVAPGPFVIDDLFPTGYGGDLTVTVTEADGRKNAYVVPYAILPQLLRANSIKYSIAAGQLQQYGVRNATPPVLLATLQYGVSNALTLYGGASFSQGYAQAKFGAAFSTPAGAISLDAATARTRVAGAGSLNGQSFGLAYNKNIPETGSNFALGAYRFSTSGYLSLPDAVNLRELAQLEQGIAQYARQKSRLDLSVSQKLGAGSLSLYGSSIDYWGHAQGRQTSLSIGYGGSWRRLGWNLSLQRSRIQPAALTADQERQLQSNRIFFGPGYQAGRIDNRLLLTLTLPLGSEPRAPSMFSNLSRSTGDNRGSAMQLGVNGLANEQGNVNYGVAVSRSSNDGSGSQGFNAYGGYQTSAASLRAGYSQSGSNGRLSASVDGGVIVHGGGVSLAQNLGDTVALVHALDAEGALLSSGAGVRIDGHGYAVAPYMTPYQLNSIGVDPRGMPADVELKDSTQTVAPTLGAVTLLEFATVSGRAVVLKALREDGRRLPFAAQVLDQQGQVVGVVGQASKAFVRGVAEHGWLTVKWGEDSSSRCRVAYQLPPREKGRRQAEVDLVQGVCTP